MICEFIFMDIILFYENDITLTNNYLTYIKDRMR